jgi:hypothetical protein
MFFTCLVLLLQALHSSEAGAQVSGCCLWLLFCHPLELILYIPQKLVQQQRILQIIPSNLHRLLQGVVPVGHNTTHKLSVQLIHSHNIKTHI